MENLTVEQEDFLISHAIPLSAVFDATGLWKGSCPQIMKQLGKWIAFGTTPCKKGRHTLRTRAGHCIQCKPAKIAFMRRHIEDGFVYVAGSVEKQIIKVGQSNNPKNRCEALNEDEEYAGVTDWTLLYFAQVSSSGDVEFRVHGILDNFAAPETYIFRGIRMDCLETFYCGYKRAVDAIESVADSIYQRWETSSTRYDFPEIAGHHFYREGNRTSHSDANLGAVSPEMQTAGEEKEPQAAFLVYIPLLHNRALQNGSLTVEEIIEEIPHEERTEEIVAVTISMLERLDVEVNGDLYEHDLPSREDLEDNSESPEEEKITDDDIPSENGVSELSSNKKKNEWYDLTPSPHHVEELIIDDDQLYDEANEYIVGLFKKLKTRNFLQAVLRVEKTDGEEGRYSLTRSILAPSKLANDTTSDEDEENIDQPVSLKKMMTEILDSLLPAQAMVIEHTYGIGKKPSALTGLNKMNPSLVGTMVGLSYQTVAPLLGKALRRLKHPSKARKLREYYGEVIRLKVEYGDDFVDHLSREQSFLVEIFGVPDPDDPF